MYECLATDYRIPAKIRWIQIQGQLKEDLSCPRNFESNLGEV